MTPEHPRAGVAHDGLNLLPNDRLVAVNRALCARRLVFVKWTSFQPELNVIPQRSALRAELAGFSVLVVAIEPDHRRDSPAFAIKPA